MIPDSKIETNYHLWDTSHKSPGLTFQSELHPFKPQFPYQQVPKALQNIPSASQAMKSLSMLNMWSKCKNLSKFLEEKSATTFNFEPVIRCWKNPIKNSETNLFPPRNSLEIKTQNLLKREKNSWSTF